jgi:hypothetical protein
MAIIDTEYAKKAKTPIIECTITRFTGDELPSVDGMGTEYSVEVVSCDISAGFDQGSATCTLVIKNPYDPAGDMVLFEPMDRVQIKQGWNNRYTLKTTFLGFVDTSELVQPFEQQRLECRDILKLAQDNHLIHSNRRVYSAVADATELDEEGNPMGGQDPEDRTAQAIISELLTDSGIKPARQILDFIEYPELGAIIIGNNQTAVFEYESALDAVNRICDLIGYRMWADQCGCVRCQNVSQIATSGASVYYYSQSEVYNNDAWTVTTTGTLLDISAKKDDDLINWVTVVGWGDITVTAAGESDYVPSPPTYRRAEIRSYLLDTPELITAVAERVYNDLNRLRYTASITIEGDPRLSLGMVVGVYDQFATQEIINYILYDYSSTFSAGQWTMNLNLTGGVGTGSPPNPNISPIALFTYSVNMEYLAGSVLYADVFVDASSSYDPDGKLEDLTYVWTVSGFANGTDVTNTYHITGQSSLTVTLTVTDAGDPPLSSYLTQTILCTAGLGNTSWHTLFVGGPGSTVYYSINGGVSWITGVTP